MYIQETSNKVSDSFLLRFTLARLYQANLTMGGGGEGERARVYLKQHVLGNYKGEIGLLIA